MPNRGDSWQRPWGRELKSLNIEAKWDSLESIWEEKAAFSHADAGKSGVKRTWKKMEEVHLGVDHQFFFLWLKNHKVLWNCCIFFVLSIASSISIYYDSSFFKRNCSLSSYFLCIRSINNSLLHITSVIEAICIYITTNLHLH